MGKETNNLMAIVGGFSIFAVAMMLIIWLIRRG